MLQDSFGRIFKSLRLSVTDRCDLRCTYCMPKEGMTWLPRADILSYEEMERLVRVFASMGVQRVRLTGGEPLLRHDLSKLVALLAKIPGIADLSLTTNGQRLAAQAHDLREAGLHRITVSLDSLDAGRFAAITRGGDLDKVWQGLERAQWEGFSPIKLNCVVLPENEADLLPLAALTLERRWEVRFIEAMPVSAALGGSVAGGISMKVLKARIVERFGALEEVPTAAHSPARRFWMPSAVGKLGFIQSVSEAFCSSCDRLRLSSTGFLQLCMAHPDGVDLKPMLRSGISDAVLARSIQEAVFRKPAGHSFYKQAPAPTMAMSRIGG